MASLCGERQQTGGAGLARLALSTLRRHGMWVRKGRRGPQLLALPLYRPGSGSEAQMHPGIGWHPALVGLTSLHGRHGTR